MFLTHKRKKWLVKDILISASSYQVPVLVFQNASYIVQLKCCEENDHLAFELYGDHCALGRSQGVFKEFLCYASFMLPLCKFIVLHNNSFYLAVVKFP